MATFVLAHTKLAHLVIHLFNERRSYINNSLHWALAEQIMSKDKHSSIFSRQIELAGYCVYNVILQILFGTRAVLKIGEYILGH